MTSQRNSTQSDVRRSLIQEIEQTSDYLLGEVLDFLLFVRAKHSQDETDIDYEDIANKLTPNRARLLLSDKRSNYSFI